MDPEGQIEYPMCSYHLVDLHFNLFVDHVRGEDIFQVVESNLYIQITPSIHHFLEFISCLTMAYLDEKNYFVSTLGTWILEVTQKLIQKALIFPFSPTIQSFTDATLSHHFVTLPPHN